MILSLQTRTILRCFGANANRLQPRSNGLGKPKAFATPMLATVFLVAEDALAKPSSRNRLNNALRFPVGVGRSSHQALRSAAWPLRPADRPHAVAALPAFRPFVRPVLAALPTFPAVGQSVGVLQARVLAVPMVTSPTLTRVTLHPVTSVLRIDHVQAARPRSRL
jgi:hypothetical protein